MSLRWLLPVWVKQASPALRGSLPPKSKVKNRTVSAVFVVFCALSIYGSALAQAAECKEVYRIVDFCPEALRGIEAVEADEKNRLLVSLQSQTFAVSAAFFDDEDKSSEEILVKKALFELLHVKNAIPDAETIGEFRRTVRGREATTFSKQNKTWNRRTVGYTTIVGIGKSVLAVTTSRAAKDLSDLDSKLHDMALDAFRIRGDG